MKGIEKEQKKINDRQIKNCELKFIAKQGAFSFEAVVYMQPG
jgi:hypothetical protein